MPVDFKREYVDQVFAFLEKRFPRVNFNNGDMILAGGEHTQYVYRLRTGRACVYSIYTDGTTDRAMWIMPGDSIGEIETLTGEKLAFDVVCCEDNTTAIRIPKDEYVGLLRENNQMCLDSARTLARKLYYVAEAYKALATNDSFGAVCRFVWRTVHHDVETYGEAVLPYTRGDIAEHCGISERTINRCIKKMEEENFVSIFHGKITVTAAQLEKLSTV